MKKIILSILLLPILAGCQLFNQTEEDISFSSPESTSTDSVEESSTISAESSTTDSSESEEANHTDTTDQENRTGVFNEKEVTPTDYPETTLGFDVDYNELDATIEDYYTNELSTEEKEANYEPVDTGTLENLQDSFNNNDVLAPLNAQVDQVTIELGNETNYVTRVTVPMTYDEASDILDEHDILLLNETLTHIGNRLVLLNYYNEDSDTVIPMHLANSTHAIFFNENDAVGTVE